MIPNPSFSSVGNSSARASANSSAFFLPTTAPTNSTPASRHCRATRSTTSASSQAPATTSGKFSVRDSARAVSSPLRLANRNIEMKSK